MNMAWRAICIAYVTAVATPSLAKDANGGFFILGAGAKSCGMFVKDFREGNEGKYENTQWMNGYLTAVNQFAVTAQNIADGTDTEGRSLWMFNYCSANPLHNVGDAASALVRELRNKSR